MHMLMDVRIAAGDDTSGGYSTCTSDVLGWTFFSTTRSTITDTISLTTTLMIDLTSFVVMLLDAFFSSLMAHP